MAAPVACIVKVEEHCCLERVEAGAEGGLQSGLMLDFPFQGRS
jgi:hypothetical protein